MKVTRNADGTMRLTVAPVEFEALAEVLRQHTVFWATEDEPGDEPLDPLALRHLDLVEGLDAAMLPFKSVLDPDWRTLSADRLAMFGTATPQLDLSDARMHGRGLPAWAKSSIDQKASA